MIDIKKMRASFEELLPPLIARADISRWTGGLYSSNTMAAYDNRGIGVKNPTLLGKKVAYNKDDLINWIIMRAEAANAKEALNAQQ